MNCKIQSLSHKGAWRADLGGLNLELFLPSRWEDQPQLFKKEKNTVSTVWQSSLEDSAYEGSNVGTTWDSKKGKSPQTPGVGTIFRGKNISQTSHIFPQIQS